MVFLLLAQGTQSIKEYLPHTGNLTLENKQVVGGLEVLVTALNRSSRLLAHTASAPAGGRVPGKGSMLKSGVGVLWSTVNRGMALRMESHYMYR